MLKLKAALAVLLCGLSAGQAVGQPAANASEKWSEWMSKRGHFQFQMRTEEVTPTVMRVRMRIRPDVARIKAEPSYSGERYFLEYYQGSDRSFTGGRGDTNMYQPRQIVFPANAPETCVYEEAEIYAVNRPDGREGSVYMDRSFSPLPLMSLPGRVVSAFESVIQFGNNVGPGAVTRFSGTSQATFKPAC